MPKVLYLGPDDARQFVAEELGDDFTVLALAAEPRQIAAELSDADVVLDASMKVPLNRDLLERAVKLKLVITATTGADHIDQSFLASRGIPLLTLKGQTQVLHNLTPAAELSWLLLMACARKLRPAIKHVEQGRWDREQFPGVLLKGKTLGLIGCGRIGQWMARYANAFGMTALGFDPYNQNWPEGLKPVSLPELLRAAHFISVHVHLTDETRGLIGAPEFALMRPGAILINTARGAVVDETALLSALESGRLSAFGFDVIEGEPNVTQSRVWQYAQTHDQCVITPHIGGFSPDALEIVLRFTARRIKETLAQ